MSSRSPRNDRSPRRGSYFFFDKFVDLEEIEIVALEDIEIKKIKDVMDVEEMDILQNIVQNKEIVVMIEGEKDQILDQIEDLKEVQIEDMKEVDLLVKIATIAKNLVILPKIVPTLQRNDMKEIVMIDLNHIEVEGVVKEEEVGIWAQDL